MSSCNVPPDPVSERDSDDWHAVTDTKARKRIQDRLAQRARRRRLKESAVAQGPSEQQLMRRSGIITALGLDAETPSGGLVMLNVDHPRSSLDLTKDVGEDVAFSPPTFMSSASSTSVLSSHPTPGDGPCRQDHHMSLTLQIPQQLSPIAAWFLNSQVLGLPICNAVPARSPLCSPLVPEALQPTSTQLLTVHTRGIDAIPLPKLRDNYIRMSGLIFEEDDFTRDLHTMPSFTITPGAAPWDPGAWKVGKEFAKKWGFLFY